MLCLKRCKHLLKKPFVMHVAARLPQPFFGAQVRRQKEVVHMEDVAVKPRGGLRGERGFARRAVAVDDQHRMAVGLDMQFQVQKQLICVHYSINFMRRSASTSSGMSTICTTMPGQAFTNAPGEEHRQS